MTNQSHTELAAHMALVENFRRSSSRSNWDAVEASARKLAALESPERGLGELVTVRLPTLTPEQAADVQWSLSEALVDAGRMDDGRMLLFVGEASTPSPQAERVPLSDEQIEDMRGEANRGMNIEREDYFKAFRDAEFIHGIVTKEST